MTQRTERINELIRAELSDLLRRQVKDPRLGCLLTVTRVAVSSDLKYAKVFVSIMGNEDEKRQALQGLSAASGFFRRELGGRLRLYRIPQLNFVKDDSIEQGSHVLKLIKQVTLDTGEASSREVEH